MHDPVEQLQPPTKRRLRRISIYKSIVGSAPGSVLEVGCGLGDLSYALAGSAKAVVATDLSFEKLTGAKKQRKLWFADAARAAPAFLQMDARALGFGAGTFAWVVSTSMIEHLPPDDLQPHLREVWRVLEPGGRYLVWCPNGLGHHKDRQEHLSMLSYREWIEKMRMAGFAEFRSSLLTGGPLVDARLKVSLERLLFGLGVKILWSHLGVRNVLLVARKPVAVSP